MRNPFWNYENEERWLSNMSAKGLALSYMALIIGLSNAVIGTLEWPYMTLNFTVGCFLLTMGLVFIGIGLPVFRKMRHLKKQRAIRES